MCVWTEPDEETEVISGKMQTGDSLLMLVQKNLLAKLSS